MGFWPRFSAIVCFLVISSVARAEEPPDELVAGYIAADQTELERIASAMSSAELDNRLGHSVRLHQLSAIAAVPWTHEPTHHLSALAETADSPDRKIAVAGTRAALTIVATLNPGVIENRELETAALADALGHWRRIVEDDGRWPDVRVDALELVTSLAKTLERSDWRDYLAARLESAEPELRRAAIELLPQPLTDASRTAVRSAIDDKDEQVSATAAAILCQGIASGDAPGETIEALGDQGKAKLTAIITASPAWLEPAFKRYIAACLAANE